MANNLNVTINMDEYIRLKDVEIKDLKRQLAECMTQKGELVPKGEPNKWMGRKEIEEIKRMYSEGFRPREIAKKIGRPQITVTRCIRKEFGIGKGIRL